MIKLEFVKIGKEYTSTHGGKWFHIYFKDETKSYRTALYKNMRNFKNWEKVIKDAERGDIIYNLKCKVYKGKKIVDADSFPKIMKLSEYNDIMEYIKQDYDYQKQ